MTNNFTAFVELEVPLGQCQDEIDAGVKAEQLLEELLSEHPEAARVKLLDVEEW